MKSLIKYYPATFYIKQKSLQYKSALKNEINYHSVLALGLTVSDEKSFSRNL
jgi:hypothetical protein